jgi:hypothetical protein
MRLERPLAYFDVHDGTVVKSLVRATEKNAILRAQNSLLKYAFAAYKQQRRVRRVNK